MKVIKFPYDPKTKDVEQFKRDQDRYRGDWSAIGLDDATEQGLDGDGWAGADNMIFEAEINLFCDMLPPQQAKVAKLLFNGYSQIEIAGILELTQQAVSHYVSIIREKYDDL